MRIEGCEYSGDTSKPISVKFELHPSDESEHQRLDELFANGEAATALIKDGNRFWVHVALVKRAPGEVRRGGRH